MAGYIPAKSTQTSYTCDRMSLTSCGNWRNRVAMRKLPEHIQVVDTLYILSVVAL